MPENRIQGQQPLWLLIEKEIQNCQADDFAANSHLATAKKVAASLDQTAYNVSGSAGNWLQLQAAIEARGSIGRPLMGDLDKAIAALALGDIDDVNATAWDILSNLRNDWPSLMQPEHRADVKDLVRHRRVDLVIEKARDLAGEQGIRFLIAESFKPRQIVKIMGITDDEYKAVQAKVDAELAEVKRVKGLLAAKTDGDDQEKIKHLLSADVADDLILEVGGFDQAALDTAKKAMEAELAEKKRLEEEAAAKKAAEAAGPSLDEISNDDMLDYIENVREILDFAGNEKEIQVMCEQSSIPKALMEIAISDPAKLDELEKKAEG